MEAVKIKYIILFFVALLSFHHQGAAQGDIEDLILKYRKPSCSEISSGSSELLVLFIEAGKLDSASLVLDYWREKCGETEPVFRSQVLLSMLRQEPLPQSMDNMLWYLNNFKERFNQVTGQVKAYAQDDVYYGYVVPNGTFDLMTYRQFTRLSTAYEEGSMEYLLSNYYSRKSDDIYNEIAKPAYSGSPMEKAYQEQVERVMAMPELHVSLITALWAPTGELSALGVHPEMGFLVGGKLKRWNYDLVLSIKFVDTKKPFMAYRKSNNTWEETNHFLGGQIGLEAGWDALVRGLHEFQLIGGVAFDGFDVLEENESRDLDSESANSYNFNVGMGYRFYTNGRFYLGLRAKYNVVDYTLGNIVDLTGNAYQIQLVMGGVNNIFKWGRLDNLGIKIRQ